MLSQKIEKYADRIIEDNHQEKDLLGIVTSHDIQKLEIMGPKNTHDDLFEKLLERKNNEQEREIENLCYIELGRKLVNVHQKPIKRQFQKTNIYIRAYLLRSIYQYVTKLAKNSRNTIYILPNVRGLHFSTEKKPDELSQYMEDSQYVQIIKNINYIIQNSLFNNKKKEEKFDSTKLLIVFSMIFLCLIGLLFMCIFLEGNSDSVNPVMIFCGFVFGVATLGILGFASHSFNSEIEIQPLCEIIMDQIKDYFTFINTKHQNKLEWRIGQSFFWIEIRILNLSTHSEISESVQ